MRIMALDVGDVRIGIAQTDLLCIIACPLETYKRVGYMRDIDYIVELAIKNEVDTIVSGLPLKMDGTDTAQTAKVREFASELGKKFTGKIILQDERLSTVSAERVLLEGGVSRENRRKVVDKMAASIILQAYLSRIKN